MKKALLTLMCLTAMMVASTSLKAQEVTIVLTPGWNWISHPSADTLDFATALGSFTPATGDIIKSRWGQAIYTNNHWMGSISQFYPGYGYMYKSNRNVPVMLTFNVQQPTPQVVVTTSEPTDITTSSATCGGNVASSNGDYISVTLKGICWGTNPNPTFNDNYIEAGNGLGSFTVSMTELTPNATYYIRAFAVTPSGTFYGNEISFHTQTWSNGVLPGAFSVSANQQVYFSQGNLQYRASTNTWRFAENQWDLIVTPEDMTSFYQWEGDDYICYYADATSQYSPTSDAWIDLFCWGTSGYNHGAICYQPWDTSMVNSDYYAYGNSSYNLFDQTGQADWGYNAISNGGNQENQWRTLTASECEYIFNSRTGIRYAKAKVNGVNGLILLPDGWSSSTYNLNNTNQKTASFNTNIISAFQWDYLEQNGAVFLPAAGYRGDELGPEPLPAAVEGVGTMGCYFLSTRVAVKSFGDSYINNVISGHTRSRGLSVRLVRNVQ